MKWMRGALSVMVLWALVQILAGGGGAPALAGSLVIDSRRDWQQWSFPQGTLELTPDGSVHPKYYRKNINACLNASQFSLVDKSGQEHVGGIRGAGSNAALAPRIMDGDMTTSWGPRRTDDPEKWYVEVDLGRLVTATRIILRFAEDADPFEEFTVFVSDGTPAFVSSAVGDAPAYQTVARVIKPNRERVLEYPLRDAYNSDVPHRSVRYVYIQLTAWRDPATSPRLAELEVMTIGDNVVAGTRERGGDITAYSAGGEGAPLIDLDGTTFWESSRPGVFPEAHWYFNLDLGGRFWVDTIILIAYPPGIYSTNVTPPVYHKLEVSDGIPQPGMAQGWKAKGPYVWRQVDEVTQNPPPGANRPLYVLDSHFPPSQVGRVFYDHLSPKGHWGHIRLREVQAYGEGFVPSATLRSQFMDLRRPVSLSSVWWQAHTPPGTSVELRTRTGNGIIEKLVYYTADGKEVRDRNRNDSSKDEYAKLPPFRRGAVDTLILPDPTWSGWSRLYAESGEAFLSPSPRRYLQIEALLQTSIQAAAASLDRIEVTYFEPLVRSVVGEISPPEVETAGVAQDFAFYILPTFDPTSRGFDEILIRTPAQAQLLDVLVGGAAVAADSVYTSRDSLWIRMPLVRRQASPLVEVRFRCTIYLNGTPFDAFVGRSSQPGAMQRVDPGEAYGPVDSQQMVVGVPVGRRLLDWNGAPPAAAFTPNGDGVNDELVFDFLVYKINSARPLGVRVYGLQGTLLRELRESGVSGRHQIAWDGRDEAGQQVPPGLYVGEVFVNGVESNAVLNRVIAVVY